MSQINGTLQLDSVTGDLRGTFGSAGVEGIAKSSDIPAISFGAFGSSPNANGGSYSGGVITLQPASASFPGGVTTGTQTFAGLKTFSSRITISSTDPGIVLNNVSGNFNIGSDVGGHYISGAGSLPLIFSTNSLNRYEISSGGNHNFKSGTATFGGALTGTSATFSGLITSTNSGQLFYRTGASTAVQYFDIANTSGRVWFGVENSSGNSLISSGGIAYSTVLAAVGANSVVFGTNGVNRYTIDASGNNTWTGSGSFDGAIFSNTALVGQNSNSTGFQIRTTSSTTEGIKFSNYANSAEWARITPNGFFKASNDGTYISSTGAYHELRTSGNIIAQISNSNASPFGLYIQHNNLTNNSTNLFIHAFEAGTQRFSVYTNGGIANYSANNVNLSDKRAKKNITKAGSYWDIIKAIEFDNYQYKDAKESRNLLGVMAQQVESIKPEWVNNAGSFGKAADGSNLKSVYEQQLQYGVNIVVQELQKRVEVLEEKLNKQVK